MPPEPAAGVVGVVLAGGQSRRMGRDKATLAVSEGEGVGGGGETGVLAGSGDSLADRAARRLAAVCPEVVLADGGRGLLARWRSVGDGLGTGPAAGILGAAQTCPDRSLLVLACDLPEVPETLLAELARPSGFDWVVPRWRGRIEPLCALYRPPALTALGELVAAGTLGPHRLAEVPGLSVRYLGSDLLARYGSPERIFANLNTPEDLALWAARTD